MSPQTPLRALFVFTPTIPGADTWVQLLMLGHLGARGVELHAAVPHTPAGAAPCETTCAVAAVQGVALRPTDFGPSLFMSTRREKLAALPGYLPAAASLVGLARYVRQHGIQVIHASDRPRDALAAVLLARMTGAKSVIHVHVKFAYWVGRATRWALHRADAVVGISEFVSRSLVEGGLPSAKVHTVLNSIEPERWDPALPAQRCRAELGVPAAAPLVLCVGRVYESKGQHTLIDALALVRRELPEARLVIAGADYPEGSGDTELLRQRARGLGLSEHVCFVGQRSDVPQLMAACDVFCMPSIEEPFGLVFAEALASARPVVAIADGGTVEVVDHGETGLLSAPNDVQALADNLLTLLRDPALRARMGAEGRRRVEARFNPERLARDVCALYERLTRRS